MRRKICWPDFDYVCLEGGCGYCQDDDRPWITRTQIELRAAEQSLRMPDIEYNVKWRK